MIFSWSGEDLVDLRHEIGRKFIDELNGLHIFVDLFYPAGARHDCTHIGILQAPGQRKLGKTSAHLFRKRLQRFHSRDFLSIR